jgi:hypothetical protein
MHVKIHFLQKEELCFYNCRFAFFLTVWPLERVLQEFTVNDALNEPTGFRSRGILIVHFCHKIAPQVGVGRK